MVIPAREISKRLAAMVEPACAKLLPGGKRVKDVWQCGDITGAPGKSLQVHLDGQRRGRWCDWAAQDTDKGDMLDLWRTTRGISLPEAIAEAKEWLGIHDVVQQRAPRAYSKPRSNGAVSLEPKALAFLCRDRKIEARIVNRFKVLYHGPMGKHSESIVFQSFNLAGELVNRSYRALPVPGQPKDVWQDTGCAPCLFGWHSLEESTFAMRSVLLCEGQIDAMTWKQWGFDALSLPNGSGQTWIEYEWDNLAGFDTIYVSFDMDGAGRENAEKCIQRLGRHRCLIVKLPEKDANDCLKAGFTSADAQRWVAEAKPPEFKNLIRGSDLKKRFLAEMQPKGEAFTLPFFRVAWPDQGFYFRPGEVTTWTGQPGHGKSTFLTFLMCYAVTGEPTFIANFETKAEKTLVRMFHALKISDSEAAIDEFIKNFGCNVIFADCVGYIKENELFEMMWFAYQRYGATQYVIDSFMRIEGLEEDYPAQGAFMNRLQQFVKSSGAHVHLVAHPRKGLGTDGKPGMMDVKGSALIPGNTDNLAAVVRNMDKMKKIKAGTLSQKERDEMHDTEVVIEKQRESGWIGSFLLRFNPQRYTFSPMKTKTLEQPTDRKDIYQ